MDYTTSDLRRMLEDAWDAAPSGDETLRPQLRIFESNASAALAGGSPASVSKNSASIAFAFGAGSLTPAAIARAWRHLIDLFDECKACLVSTDDAAIMAEMKLRLVPVSEFHKDFMLVGTI